MYLFGNETSSFPAYMYLFQPEEETNRTSKSYRIPRITS